MQSGYFCPLPCGFVIQQFLDNLFNQIEDPAKKPISISIQSSQLFPRIIVSLVWLQWREGEMLPAPGGAGQSWADWWPHSTEPGLALTQGGWSHPSQQPGPPVPPVSVSQSDAFLFLSSPGPGRFSLLTGVCAAKAGRNFPLSPPGRVKMCWA